MLDLRKWAVQVQPTWLRAALNLLSGDVPRGFFVEADSFGEMSPPIMLTLDAYQAGIAVATVEQDTAVDGQLTALSPLLVLGAESTTFKLNADVVGTAGLILCMSVTPSALAAPRHIQLEIANNVLDIPIGGAAVASATKATWKDIAGTADARIYVPPGWFVLVRALDLVGAETFDIQTQILRVPAGFKPF